ncbi:class III lanthionine synthetase LanKC [Propionibacterium acidifaciens]|nr:class III lanthionine synthetase LanKC [Propionibacterium acidifaciens]
MDMKYLAFCYADPAFYDIKRDTTNGSGARRFELPRDRDWTSWSLSTGNGWEYVMPPGMNMPEQGWKIHVSATMENAQKLLGDVASYCHASAVPFKFLPTRTELMRTNMKYAHRGGSGKFITIYPDDDEQCARIAAELDAIIGGAEGPYILSDIRYHGGPVYLRYGGFRPLLMRSRTDELSPAIRNPSGELVEDDRQPVFRPPEWVQIPDFIRAQMDALNSGDRPEEFPYAVLDAMHFSNGGGIYRAIPDGQEHPVVLKEARPHAGISPDGTDAVARLLREAEFLDRLADLPEVVRCHRVFKAGEHCFMEEELIEGTTLNSEMVMRSPEIRAGVGNREILDYRDWALATLAKVERTVHAFHEHGIVFGDLHPNNIIVTPDGDIRFIDFEMAHDVDDPTSAPAGAPGYIAEDGRTGIAADLYGLGCIKLSMFVPLTVLLPLDHSKLRGLVEHARQFYALSDEFCASIVADISLTVTDDNPAPLRRRARVARDAWCMDDPEAVAEIDAAIVRGLDEALDLSRPDRVWPGDVSQFDEGGYGIATGACGVLLAHPEARQREDVLDWIEETAADSSKTSFGFYNGLAGAAWTLDRLGRGEAAGRLFEKVRTLHLPSLPSDLYSGLSGIGICLMDQARRHNQHHYDETIAAIHEVMLDRFDEDRSSIVREVNGTATAAVGKGGLMQGMAGQALYWICSHELTGDDTDPDRASTALDRDLALLVQTPDGSLQLNEGWRVLPYLATGSIGIGLVIMRLLEHRPTDELVRTLHGIERTLVPPFAVQSNLFNGRAGFLLFADRLLQCPWASISDEEVLARQARLLNLHALVRGTGIVFPGEQLMRLSCDWSSGSAGVLSVLRLYESRHLKIVPPNLFRTPLLDRISVGHSGNEWRGASSELIMERR